MRQSQRRNGPDRRGEPRYRINSPAILLSKERGMAAVRVLDISSSGVRISSPYGLPLDAEVEVRFENAKIFGVVRQSRCVRASEFHLRVSIMPRSDTAKEAPTQKDYVRVLRLARLLNRGVAIDRRAGHP